ncbi:lysine decarboxylase 1 [Escherichia coli]|uniref:Lysine decarboxylase 1 n=1 Tax=Escherichia coli TaxID=562 RepID=A0A377DZH0_ECOLX|nr:lysine decarboxylase 1 [Escherichia coli]
MIHVKGDVNEETFNEAYMMHTTTSPHYGIVASTETAAAMMKGNAGKRLKSTVLLNVRSNSVKRSNV